MCIYFHYQSSLKIVRMPESGSANHVSRLVGYGIAGSQRGDKWIVGYFGHLTDAWFDWSLIFDLARSRADITFEIIGYGEPDWVRQKSRSITQHLYVG
jgi:hypothetical protein